MKQLENDKTEKKTEISAMKEAVFSKEQLSKSKSFKKYIDIISAVIGDNEKVTKAEAQKRIDSFLKRRVD